MVVPVVGLGDGEQRRDRPALDDPEVVVDQTPLDVLRTAEVGLDPPSEPHQPQDLPARQRRPLPPLRVDLHLPRAAAGQRLEGVALGGNRLGDDLVVPDGEDVRVHQAGDQGLAEPEAGVHRGDPPVARDGVGREEDAGRVGEGHPLDDHGHADRAVVDAVAPPVGHGPLGEQRGPAPPDVPEDLRRPHDVQVAVLLAGEGGRRQVLRRGAGADGVGVVLAEPGERARDRLRDVVRDGERLDGPADLRTERTGRLPVVRVQAGQPVEQAVERRRSRQGPPEGVRGHAEAGRHADAVDPRQRAQVRALAPTTATWVPSISWRSHTYRVSIVFLFPRVVAEADDSAARPGPCRKPPVRYKLSRARRAISSPSSLRGSGGSEQSDGPGRGVDVAGEVFAAAADVVVPARAGFPLGGDPLR